MHHTEGEMEKRKYPQPNRFKTPLAKQLEEIWEKEGLRSPFFKALWAKKHGSVVARTIKEKIPDEELTG